MESMQVRPGSAASPIETLFPGYFALVMATGIIAIASAQQGLDVVADILYAIAAVAYVVLAVMTVARVILYPRALFADAVQHVKGFAFLTIVAGTNVLAAASGVIHGWWSLTWVLWYASLGLWVIFVYTTLISVVIRDDKPGLENGINGTWFLLTVSVESIAVVAGLLIPRSDSDLLVFVALAAFTLGILLYMIVMTMVFLRWTFLSLDPTEVDPPAWIAAGAVAITVLAGSNILLAAPSSDRITDLVPFVEGMVIMAWASSTFWFPLMVAIGLWRHVIRRLLLRYHPAYWSLVFPIGMYGAATSKMLAAIDLDHLGWLPEMTLVFSLLAWGGTAFGLVHLAVTSRPRARPPTSTT